MRLRPLLVAGATAAVVIVAVAGSVVWQLRQDRIRAEPDYGGVVGEKAGPSLLDPFGAVEVVIVTPEGKEVEWCALSADTSAQRGRGLMERTSLVGYEGMLFRYPGQRPLAFWMRNTPMPLSVAFYDSGGRFVSSADMEPCGDSPGCPLTYSAAPAQFAVEVEQGRLEELGVVYGSVLRVGAPCDP